MRRDDLSDTESVAEQFRVSVAKNTRRRLARVQDAIDWELLADVLDAAGFSHSEPWPDDPLTGLVQLLLGRSRPVEVAHQAAKGLITALGTWDRLLEADSVPRAEAQALGVTDAELGHLRTLLLIMARRVGACSLTALAEMTDDRAVRLLTGLSGVDMATACTVMLRSFSRVLLPPTPAVRRVLTRMGVLPPGVSDSEARKVLSRLSPCLPLDGLFAGITALAEQTCADGQPRCDSCPVRKLCARGRLGLRREPAPEALSFVDLFAGAGGMSLGLSQVGLRPLLAVEKEPWACETYRLNHPDVSPERVLCADITTIVPEQGSSLLGESRPDLVVGGPPCQGFSLIGKRGRSANRFTDDPRNRLYNEFVKWVVHLKPRFVVMENVPGLYSYADGTIREDIARSLQEAGYAMDSLVVDASHFGVPQRRQRVLFIGASSADFGEGSAQLSQRIVELLGSRGDPEVTLQEAIGDLPPLDAAHGREAAAQPLRPLSGYAERMRAGEQRVLYHHVARPINLRDLLLYSRLRPGETGDDAVRQDARHLMVYRNDVFQDKYRRLRYDEPSPTIMSHLAKDGHMFIHPDPNQKRSLTVREAARIQSFPDDFIFRGGRTHQFTQVGNAVPPLLAQAIGEAIITAMTEVSP